ARRPTSGLQARAPEDQRRGVLPRGRVRDRGAGTRQHRPPVRGRRQDGRAARGGRRRRELHPRGDVFGEGPHPPGDGRLHGHAGDGAQRAGAAGDDGEDGPADAGAVGDQRPRGGRAVHPPAGDPPPREGPGRRAGRRHGQPVLHDRHLRRPPRHRDRGRRPAEGHEGRRHLLGRPEEGPRRHAVPRDHLRAGAPRRTEGDGPDGVHDVQAAEAAAGRLQPADAGQRRPRDAGRRDRDEDQSL
ncbi:MAG: Uridine monophosphate kinase, partial [uncultured Phycisphaerae bacterium]